MRTVYHYLVDGEEVDSTPFRLFYNNLIGLQAQKRTSEAPEVSGDPDFKLVFTKVDGTKLTTEFYLADERTLRRPLRPESPGPDQQNGCPEDHQLLRRHDQPGNPRQKVKRRQLPKNKENKETR